jgi:hypothetical protein
MREFRVAVRPDGATGVQVGINHGRERRGAFHNRIESELQFAQVGEIRAEARCDDDFIDGTHVAVTRAHVDAIGTAFDRFGLKRQHDLKPA